MQALFNLFVVYVQNKKRGSVLGVRILYSIVGLVEAVPVSALRLKALWDIKVTASGYVQERMQVGNASQKA
jgi:hypothetical protein